MNIEQSGLSVDQARNRVLAALAERYPDLSFRVQDHAMLAREFGWVFTLEIVGVRNTTAVTKGPIPRLALVNRTSAQAIIDCF